MKRFVIICWLMTGTLWAQGVHSKTLRPLILETPDISLSDVPAVRVNDTLFFARTVNGESQAWTYDVATQALTDLNIGRVTDFYAVGNLAIIVSQNNLNSFTLYQSDGQLDSTNELATTGNFRVEYSAGAIYLIEALEVHKHDGSSFQSFSGLGQSGENHLQRSDFCEVNENEFLLLTKPRSDDDFLVVQSSLGQAPFNLFCEQINCDIVIESVGDACFISKDNNRGFRELQFRVTSNGTWERLNGLPQISEYRRWGMLNDRLYAVGAANFANHFFIHEVDPQSLTSIRSTRFDLTEDRLLQPWQMPEIIPTIDQLVIMFEQLIWLDQSLNEVPDTRVDVGDFYAFFDQATHIKTNHGTWLVADCVDPFCGIFNRSPDVWLLNTNGMTERFRTADSIQIEHLRLNPLNQQVMITATDTKNRKKGHHELTDDIAINRLMNGIWYTPELSNQGLSINQGTRHDGSEYLFISVYLYEDGQPLWLAGNTTISGLETHTEVTLYRFDGPQFFMPDEPANRSLFGEVELSLESCDVLLMNLNDGTLDHQWRLNRADNTYHSPWCQ
jgi:hypothetical protein